MPSAAVLAALHLHLGERMGARAQVVRCILIPALVWLAALALAALLIVLFPANIHAAGASLLIAGRRATPLALRLPLQVFWFACLLWVATTSR